eukprot:11387046-Karenia_brevis.AAC.1
MIQWLATETLLDEMVPPTPQGAADDSDDDAPMPDVLEWGNSDPPTSQASSDSEEERDEVAEREFTMALRQELKLEMSSDEELLDEVQAAPENNNLDADMED